MNGLKTIDLFAGCGGLSLGFERAGYEIMASFDNWEPAIEVYRDNFKNHQIIKLDLNGGGLDYNVFKNLNPDVIIGGPPCQDFSIAGKRNENGGRANLTLYYSRIVTFVKPKYFVMENVPRIEKSNTLKKTKKEFKKAGYGLTETVLDASLYGVPQKRRRFFLIGELDGADNFLTECFKKNKSKKPMTLRDYFGDELRIEHYYRHPRSYARRGIFSIDEPSPTVRGVNRPVPDGYKGHPGDTAPISSNIRSLTTEERAKIQTFPKWFKFKGSKSDLDLMIGNAVPVKLAEYVAKCLKTYALQTKLKVTANLNHG